GYFPNYDVSLLSVIEHPNKRGINCQPEVRALNGIRKYAPNGDAMFLPEHFGTYYTLDVEVEKLCQNKVKLFIENNSNQWKDFLWVINGDSLYSKTPFMHYSFHHIGKHHFSVRALNIDGYYQWVKDSFQVFNYDLQPKVSVKYTDTLGCQWH